MKSFNLQKSVLIRTLFALCIFVGTIPITRANIILNGSFESPNIEANFSQQPPTDWVSEGTFDPVIVHGNVSGYPSPEDGNQFVDIAYEGSPTPIGQSFGVGTGGMYQLTWYDNALNDPAYTVEILDSGSTTITSAQISFSPTGPWNARSLSLTLSPGTYTLEFTPGGLSLDVLLDNVSLNPVPVPESSTMIAGILLLLPLGASTVRLLRKRSAT